MRNTRSRDRLVLPLGLVLAATLRLGWLVIIPNAQVADAHWYYARALAIAAGQGYTVDGVATAFWPIGYPAFLAALFALFGTSPWVGELANVVLALVAIVLAYALALRLFDRPAVARYTLLLLALYPTFIAHTSLLLSELLFVPLMLLGVLLLLPQQLALPIRLLRLVVAGMVLGLATLTRPQAALIPVAVYAALVLQRRVAGQRGAQSAAPAGSWAIVYLSLALVLLPWTARNRETFGGFVFVSTNGGFNLYVGNGPFATGTYLTQSVIDAQIAPLAATASSEAGADRLLRNKALEEARANPLATLARLPRKLWYLYRSDIEAIKLNETGIAPLAGSMRATLFAYKLLAQAYYLALLLAAAIALVVLPRTRRVARSLVGLSIVLTFTLFQLVYFGGDRFHFPMMPWVTMYAADLIAHWRER